MPYLLFILCLFLFLIFFGFLFLFLIFLPFAFFLLLLVGNNVTDDLVQKRKSGSVGSEPSRDRLGGVCAPVSPLRPARAPRLAPPGDARRPTRPLPLGSG